VVDVSLYVDVFGGRAAGAALDHDAPAEASAAFAAAAALLAWTALVIRIGDIFSGSSRRSHVGISTWTPLTRGGGRSDAGVYRVRRGGVAVPGRRRVCGAVRGGVCM
jgi:hypothetical protein